MDFLVMFLKACEAINSVINQLFWVAVKLLLLTPVFVIGWVIYLVLF